MDREREKEILAAEQEKNKNLCWVCKEENKKGQYRRIRWPKPAWSDVSDAFVVRFQIFFCEDCLALPLKDMKRKWRTVFEKCMGRKWVEKVLSKSVCLWDFF